MIDLGILKPIKFHPYTSVVLDRIIELPFDSKDDIDQLREYLVLIFNHHNIKAWTDNKTVFECEIKGNTIFYGFYDLKFSIGFRCQTR